MDTKNKSFWFLLLFVMAAKLSYSEEFCPKELKWAPCDSITAPTFEDTTQIIEWGKSIGSPLSKKTRIGDNNIFILMVDICSGLYCPVIYIFKEKENNWQLITSSSATLQEQIEIEIDYNLNKIIFKTKSRTIGELPFDIFNPSP